MSILIRLILVAALGIGLPVFIYLAFIADEPLLEVEYDVDLGQKIVASIAADPEEYPILAEEDYADAYAYLRGMVREIVQGEAVEYEDLFAYDSVRIVDDDNTLNAFCVPGGFIYVYTGLIKYLDAEDHLAGVLGHEIAHAERRHSAAQMQKEFGKQRILEFVVLSLPMTLSDVVFAAMLNKLTNLSYSREHEAESDYYSVQYLADTDYACDGAAGFFEKITRAGDAAPIPELLSDHPDPESRVRDVRAAAADAGCGVEMGDQSHWLEFQASFDAQ